MEAPNKDLKQNPEETAPDMAPETAEKTEEDAGNEQTAAQKDNRSQSRRSIIYMLAGAYLIYLGYNLCKSVIQGEDGASPLFFAAGAAFVILGAVFCILEGKKLLEADKEKKAKEQKKNTPAPAAEQEKKSMSISERAKLVSPPEEEEADKEE